MKCVYHNDMDGRCAGSLVAYFTGNRNPDDYIEADYKDFPIDKINPRETVYIVDYSFTKHTVHHLYKMVYEMHCDVIWIDHHASSIKLPFTGDYKWVIRVKGLRCQDLSGAGLVYAYFMGIPCDQPELLPKYIQYVDDYDRWIYRLGEDSTYFKLGLETIEFDALDNVWEELRTCPEKADALIALGAIIKQYIDRDNAEYLKNFGYASTLAGLDCYVVNRKTNSWIFADKIMDYPVVSVFAFDGEWFHYSLYSTDPDIDCSKIAEQFGGGGHPGAAGFKSKELIFKKKE